MSLGQEIDGRQATRLVQDYFMEQYGQYGVTVFEVESLEYDKDEKKWTLECSFFRTLLTQQKSHYSVVVYLDGKIGPVKKLAEPSR